MEFHVFRKIKDVTSIKDIWTYELNFATRESLQVFLLNQNIQRVTDDFLVIHGDEISLKKVECLIIEKDQE